MTSAPDIKAAPVAPAAAPAVSKTPALQLGQLQAITGGFTNSRIQTRQRLGETRSASSPLQETKPGVDSSGRPLIKKLGG